MVRVAALRKQRMNVCHKKEEVSTWKPARTIC
jgi:hypothetical protein